MSDTTDVLELCKTVLWQSIGTPAAEVMYVYYCSKQTLFCRFNDVQRQHLEIEGVMTE